MTATRCRSSTFSGTRSRPTTRSCWDGQTKKDTPRRSVACSRTPRRASSTRRGCATRSLPRVAKLMEIRAQNPGKHRVIWHDLEAERHALEKALPEAVSVYGARDLDTREGASSTSPRAASPDDRQARDARERLQLSCAAPRPSFWASDTSSMTSSKPSTRVYRFGQRTRDDHHRYRRATQSAASLQSGRSQRTRRADDGHRP